jgi:DNA replication and repair protein RecF
MRLKQIQLTNFRNFSSLDVEFDVSKNVNLFVGDNAQGKTNFLDAIALLSLAKSFRTSKYNTLIKWDEDFTRVVGDVDRNVNDGNDLKLEFFASIAPVAKKNLRKNGVDVGVKDFIGQLNTVLFHPEDMNMLCLSPSLRRKYVDTILSQTDPLYFDAIVNYNRLIKQRNKLLALIHDGDAKIDELIVWDDKVAMYGIYIGKKRTDLVKFFNTVLPDNYNKISQTGDEVSMKYVQSLILNVQTKEEYLNGLKRALNNDLRYGQSTRGVHRDDVKFDYNGHDISEFGSRGEMRTIVIALKLSEITYIEREMGRKPILLLDDVFSELDKSRQQFLIETISGFQSFVTTTHHDFEIGSEAVFEIEGGRLK